LLDERRLLEAFIDCLLESRRWRDEDGDAPLALMTARAEAARDVLMLADEVARLTKWGITVTDCREGCDHPACLILRAIARYEKARAALAAAAPGGISDSGGFERLME
jgi:hypothetical protein